MVMQKVYVYSTFISSMEKILLFSGQDMTDIM